jgi:hypothetical protein
VWKLLNRFVAVWETRLFVFVPNSMEGFACERQCPSNGGGATAERFDNRETQLTRKKQMLMQPRLQKNSSRARGTRENGPPFFPDQLPDHAEFKGLFALKRVR